MLTAHLPSGYILARMIRRPIPWLMPVALTGAVFPDLDMIWFHLVDHRAFHHHYYWVHIPAFWAALAVVALPLAKLCGVLAQAAVFLAAIFVHLVLDTLSGGVMWGAPFSRELVTLVEVPATQSHWVLSFLMHWSFLAELAIWTIAMALWWRRKA